MYNSFIKSSKFLIATMIIMSCGNKKTKGIAKLHNLTTNKVILDPRINSVEDLEYIDEYGDITDNNLVTYKGESHSIQIFPLEDNTNNSTDNNCDIDEEKEIDIKESQFNDINTNTISDDGNKSEVNILTDFKYLGNLINPNQKNNTELKYLKLFYSVHHSFRNNEFPYIYRVCKRNTLDILDLTDLNNDDLLGIHGTRYADGIIKDRRIKVSTDGDSRHVVYFGYNHRASKAFGYTQDGLFLCRIVERESGELYSDEILSTAFRPLFYASKNRKFRFENVSIPKYLTPFYNKNNKVLKKIEQYIVYKGTPIFIDFNDIPDKSKDLTIDEIFKNGIKTSYAKKGIKPEKIMTQNLNPMQNYFLNEKEKTYIKGHVKNTRSRSARISDKFLQRHINTFIVKTPSHCAYNTAQYYLEKYSKEFEFNVNIAPISKYDALIPYEIPASDVVGFYQSGEIILNPYNISNIMEDIIFLRFAGLITSNYPSIVKSPMEKLSYMRNHTLNQFKEMKIKTYFQGDLCEVDYKGIFNTTSRQRDAWWNDKKIN